MQNDYLCWSNCTSYDQSDYTVIEIPDEFHSHSVRKGTSQAPDMIRKISRERDVYFENNLPSLAYSNMEKPHQKFLTLETYLEKKSLKSLAKYFKTRKFQLPWTETTLLRHKS